MLTFSLSPEVCRLATAGSPLLLFASQLGGAHSPAVYRYLATLEAIMRAQGKWRAVEEFATLVRELYPDLEVSKGESIERETVREKSMGN